MIRPIRPMLVALLFAGVWNATPSVATDLDALMRGFRVTSGDRKPAPGFSLTTLDGTTAALADHRGRVVLVYFWATW